MERNDKTSAVAAADDIAPGKFVKVKVDGPGYIIARVEDRYYAVEDNCSHEDYPLSYGCLDGKRIKCSLHGSWFSLETGEPQEPPAEDAIATFRIEERDGRPAPAGSRRRRRVSVSAAVSTPQSGCPSALEQIRKSNASPPSDASARERVRRPRSGWPRSTRFAATPAKTRKSRPMASSMVPRQSRSSLSRKPSRRSKRAYGRGRSARCSDWKTDWPPLARRRTP
jgi:3-phenylpropionate/trans-cinnamate dioxygenase ferredoxin subunit